MSKHVRFIEGYASYKTKNTNVNGMKQNEVEQMKYISFL